MESNCGVAIISPMYWGRVRPQCYQLTYRGNYAGTHDTQAEAKMAAQRIHLTNH